MACITSCREDSDEILSHGKWSVENFKEANSTMEGQFKVFWTAMNCNYPIWDYEAEFGVDWDAVYKEYLPVFREADRKHQAENTIMPDSVFHKKYEEIISLLHDGHTFLHIKNLHTGALHHFSPSVTRLLEREDWESEYDFKPKTSYYESEAVNEDERIVETMKASDVYQYARFKDGIVYLRMKDCNLPNHFNEAAVEYSSMASTQARLVWRKWFDAIQELHGKNTLKGVVIDVRGNGGGPTEISQYVFGALHNNRYPNSNAYQRGYIRMKNGIGRLDFFPKVPWLWTMCKENHADIHEPIVVLANYITASGAEHICLDAKEMPNACVIGTNTCGALSPLSEKLDSLYYVGCIGKAGETSFYMDIPSAAFMTDEGEFLEGKGVMPDIEVKLDLDLFLSTGRDKQLERALEFIRNKK
jgi:hypothetical protein